MQRLIARKPKNTNTKKKKQIGRMLPETKELLEEFFKPHNLALEELLKWTFSFWYFRTMKKPREFSYKFVRVLTEGVTNQTTLWLESTLSVRIWETCKTSMSHVTLDMGTTWFVHMGSHIIFSTVNTMNPCGITQTFPIDFPYVSPKSLQVYHIQRNYPDWPHSVSTCPHGFPHVFQRFPTCSP